MKTFRILMAATFFSTVLAFSQPAISFAKEAEHSQEDIQMLRDAAAALKAVNPDLAEKLSKYADREASEEREEREENKK